MTGQPNHTSCQRTFLLVAILAAQGVGWFLVWPIVHWDAQNRAQQALADSGTALFVITLPVKQVDALRIEDHEIRWQGKLCDIQSTTCLGDSVRLVLYHDRYEETVFDKFSDLFNAGKEDSKQHFRVSLAKWLSAVFLLSHPPELLAPVAAPMNPGHFLWRPPATQHVPGCHAPPPKFTGIVRRLCKRDIL